MNWSQAELAKRTDISKRKRSITSYENKDIIPRGTTVHKLARELSVSYDYLMHDEETNPPANQEHDAFVNMAREQYGNMGAGCHAGD